ncbi:MAG: 16S rRNA (guanine(966)-N(2))-methyltransferase RsmD [Desulfobacterales bacterium]
MGIRVIGGDLKGRRLHTIRGQTIRPTADRIKESIFNILAGRVRKAQVLDLFAGTGALGIEALSRGAASAIFIDNDHKATQVIKANLKLNNLENRSKCIRWDATKNLNCLATISPIFDLVLMDPPYNRNHVNPALTVLHRSGSMQNAALVIVEHAMREPILEGHIPFVLTDQRRYRKSLVSFLTHMI